MIYVRRASRLGYAALASAALSCSSSVQELGRSADEPAASAAHAESEHDGFGAAWACPDAPLGRELACPLTRPIEGDACPSRNTAPCSYVGEPPARPDTSHTTDDEEPSPTTTFCICTRDLRWACLQGVTMRTLDLPFRDGDPCEDNLTVEVNKVVCACEGGRVRCSR